MGDIVTPLRDALRDHGPIPQHTRIALERTLAGMSARHCARALDVSHSTWHEIERGIRAVGSEDLKRIAQILGVTLRRLRGEQVDAVPGWKKQGRPRREQAAA
jgi:transcriptional regulator with XRE-family HTH domain